MKRVIKLYLLSLFLFSCHAKEGGIVILIKIQNSNIKKLYFTDAYQWQVLLDSATGGPDFKFIIPKEKLPQSLCSIAFINNKNKIVQLEFDNRILSTDSTKYVYSAFIPDMDTIRIHGDLKESKYYFIQAGEETKSLYATQMMNFGYLDADVAKRTRELENYIAVIKKYPSSSYLLSQIYENKAAIKRKELDILLSNFNANKLNTGIGKQVKEYADKKEETPVLPAMVLEDETGRPAAIIDSTAKLNMIVMWASWCGPCRREIPEINAIQNKYKDKGLKLVSISTDNSKEEWQQALLTEKMPWQQLIVPDKLRQEFNSKYEVSAIPDVIFTDSKGKVIERFIGYKEGQSKEYEAVITNNLRR